MVGSNYEYILVGHRTHYLRQLAVKILQSLAVALYVVAVSVQRIGIHQVGKYKASDAVLQEIYGGLNACRVVGGMIYGGYAPLVEYILYLANGHSLKALCGKAVQYGVLYRRYGVIPAVLRAGILAVSAYERTCDDAAHKVVANQYLPCLLAHGVQLIERYYILMGSYLKYAVRRCIYYWLTRSHVFIAQLLNYNGA